VYSFVDMQQQKDERLSPQDRSRMSKSNPASGPPVRVPVVPDVGKCRRKWSDRSRMRWIKVGLQLDFKVSTLYLHPRSIILELITLAFMATRMAILRIVCTDPWRKFRFLA
jgi:hypothetical protein